MLKVNLLSFQMYFFNNFFFFLINIKLKSKIVNCSYYNAIKIVIISYYKGEVLGSLCYLKGPEIYGQCRDYVLQLIKDNMERDTMDTGSAFEDDCDSSDSEKSTSPAPKQRARVCIIFG